MSDSLPGTARLFLGGRWICSAGDWLGSTALGWFIVNELDGGSAAFAVNRLLLVVGLLACASGVGAMLQRIPAAAVLLVSCAVAAVLSLIGAVFAWTAPGQDPLTQHAFLLSIVLLGVIGGISHSMRDAGEQRIQVLLVPREEQHHLERVWTVMYYVGRIIFAMLSALFLARFGSAMLFLLDGMSYLLLGVCTVVVWRELRERETDRRMRVAEHIEDPIFRGFWRGVVHGLRHYFLAFRAVRQHPEMLLLLWLTIVIEGIGFTAWTLLPEIISKGLGDGGFSYGLVIAIGGVGGLLGAVVYLSAGKSRKPWSPKLFMASLFLCPIGLIGVALSDRAWLLGVAYGFALCGWSWFLPSLRVFFRVGDDGPLTTSMLTFTIYGICRLSQVLIVITLRCGLDIAPSNVLLISSGASLATMIVTVIFARRLLASSIRKMFHL